MSTDATDWSVVDRPDSDGGELIARVVEYAGRPDECTIYPADVEPGAAVTTWIAAEGESFISLTEMR